ncbi:MAG: acyl-CoA dehydrogenase [Oceanococcus sp.]|nr:MAG: acyl-CoA dehydrogenase [Oceanococcus sp.]
MKSPYYTPEHDAFREQVRRFVESEITPHIQSWEDAGQIPRALYKRCAELGLLGIGYPDTYGGTPVDDGFYPMIFVQELCRSGSGGIVAALGSLGIGLPPILALGSESLKQQIIPDVLAGEQIAALAITEPGGGSDVANLSCRAERDGDHYVVSGSKTFITQGMQADWFTVAVRTGGAGIGGISLLAINAASEGFSRTPLRKMGWHCSDTATLYFDQCRVPVNQLIGTENQGFLGIMRNFNNERLALAAQACGLAAVCIEESRRYAEERKTFGKPLSKHQVIRHKLVEMQGRYLAAQALLEQLTWRVDHGEVPIAELCMLKNFATATLEYIAGEAVQIHGGAGFMHGSTVERIFRETKVLSIGGGASEVMADLAARQMGL